LAGCGLRQPVFSFAICSLRAIASALGARFNGTPVAAACGGTHGFAVLESLRRGTRV